MRDCNRQCIGFIFLQGALVVEKADPAEYAKTWVSENGALVDSWLN
jgi:ABC-type proline/glycine betaine transport system substrate-binding protein